MASSERTRRRRALVKQQKVTLYERQRGCCYICGEHTPLEEMTVDHVRPRALRLAPASPNKLLACRRCNLVKSDSAPTLDHLAALILVHEDVFCRVGRRLS